MDNLKRKELTAWLSNLLLALVIYIGLSYALGAGLFSRYWQGVLMLVFINIILAVSLNLVTGFLGQLTLGHAGFMSVGAYTAALMTKNVLPETLPRLAALVIAMLAGGFAAAVCGILIGVPALRLRGDYIAIITLGFGEIIRVIVESMAVTGGPRGLRGIPKISTLPVAYWTTVVVIVSLAALIHSRHGRAIMSIREDEVAAEAAGVNTTFYKSLAFVVSAFMAGLGGAIFAHYTGLLGATTFNFNRSIEILVIVVLGGMGSVTGSVAAAVVLTLLPELLRGFSDYRMLVYSVLLVVMMIVKPGGLLGRHEFKLSRLIDAARGRVKKKGNKGDKGDKEVAS
ncbi:MAG TPA: branched-chain amino acid ABC transporter permease [Candidatus Acidoferrum sp.]|nr:branched-chain amino acid ABC transporter permease [Candidatus Acidoferrum sp.]